MKRTTALLPAFLCLLILVGCSEKSILKDISSTERIEIYAFETETTVEVTDRESIDRICDNLLSLKLSKMDYNKPTHSVYTLTFFDADGNQIEAVGIPAHDWIGYNCAFYNVTEGSFDREYIAELLK